MAVTEQELAELMRCALAGDGKSYRQFLTAVTPKLRAGARRHLARLGSTQADAEDIVQETLLAIHNKRQTWDPCRPIGPWLAAIARHKLIDQLRRKGESPSVPLEDIEETFPASDPPPELGQRDIETMLRRLNSRQQSIVRAVSIDGTSIKDTALRLGMSEGAVRVTLHRSLRILSVMFRGATP
jgi:RNA polymerase sigma-70 factor (ECF subfamily)